MAEGNMMVITATLLACVALVTAQQAAPPGVNPSQYRQPQMPQQVPPQQQVQYQQQQYQQQPLQNAPGVPPQQYQQQQFQNPPPPPQQQPLQQQYQQQPPQQPPAQQPPAQQPPAQQQPAQQQPAQQPPAQQQPAQQPPLQQQPPQQQPPLQHGPHVQANAGQKMLHKPSLTNEREHIKDHLEVPLDTSGMTEQELQFHYFKMHDADNNNQLDGQELIKSLFHWHDADNHDPTKQQPNAPHPPQENKLFTDDELATMIDPILEQDDHNKDGYIDYVEFMAAQHKTVNTANAADNKL